jgi:CRISPR/Cas system endoribonuclease Cas6 (RAMP superfamily)
VVERQVSVDYDHLRLARHALFFDGARTGAQGFIGMCCFTVHPARVAPEHRTILAALARYSYYAGTGRKTTMGMGMTRFLGGQNPNRKQSNAPVS